MVHNVPLVGKAPVEMAADKTDPVYLLVLQRTIDV